MISTMMTRREIHFPRASYIKYSKLMDIRTPLQSYSFVQRNPQCINEPLLTSVRVLKRCYDRLDNAFGNSAPPESFELFITILRVEGKAVLM